MADEVKLDIKITVPTSVEPAGDMPNKWADGLTNNAERMNDRRIAKIPDEGTFQSLIATPSSAKYAPMIAAAFKSKSGKTQSNITRSQYKNLANSFDDWDAKLALAFATVDGVPAKRFKDQVNNSKNNWAEAVASKTLRATGDKIRGTLLGQVLFWMVGDYNANQMTNAMEIIDGGPYDFTKPGYISNFKTTSMQQLISGLIRILDADMLAAEVTAQNDALTLLCNTLRDSAIVPVKAFIVDGVALDSLFQFEYADPTLVFHARVVLV
ncbi:hypothetical protein ES703_41391 [subsurface metagenome]